MQLAAMVIWMMLVSLVAVWWLLLEGCRGLLSKGRQLHDKEVRMAWTRLVAPAA